MPDAGIIAEVLVLPFAGVLWWLFRKTMADNAELAKVVSANAAAHNKALAENSSASEKALAEYKLHVAETFTTKNDLSEVIKSFNRSVDAIFAKLDKIEGKLDMKADKP